MSGSALAFVLLRTAAMYFVYKAVMFIPSFVSNAVGWSMTSNQSLVLLIGFFLFYLAMSFVLWFSAEKIGRKVAGPFGGETDAISPKAQDLLQAGIILFGFYLIVMTVPSFTSEVVGYALGDPLANSAAITFLLRHIVMLVLGMIFILYPNSMIGLIQRIRRAGSA